MLGSLMMALFFTVKALGQVSLLQASSSRGCWGGRGLSALQAESALGGCVLHCTADAVRKENLCELQGRGREGAMGHLRTCDADALLLELQLPCRALAVRATPPPPRAASLCFQRLLCFVGKLQLAGLCPGSPSLLLLWSWAVLCASRWVAPVPKLKLPRAVGQATLEPSSGASSVYGVALALGQHH